MMAPRFLLVALAILALAAIAVSAQNDAAQHTDCESCVENGWGWSWSKGECGGYLNTNCDPDSADALDEDEDESENAVPEQQQQPPQQRQQQAPEPVRVRDPAPIPSEPLPWANTEQTTRLWQLCHSGDIATLRQWLMAEPEVVHLRAEDGRGPLWWAHEYEKWDIIDLLKERGADFDAVDVNEQKPADLLPAGAQRDEL